MAAQTDQPENNNGLTAPLSHRGSRVSLRAFTGQRQDKPPERPAAVSAVASEGDAGLFRKHATDHAARRLTGEVIIASPPALATVNFILVSLVAFAFTFAAFGSYARKETISGWIVPDLGLIRVAARQGGILNSIAVDEGQDVPAGAPLAIVRVSADVVSGDAGRLEIDELEAEGAAAAAKANATIRKTELQRAGIVARRDYLTRQLGELRARTELLQQRQALAQANVARGEQLFSRDVMAAQTLEQIRATLLGAANDVSQSRSAEAEAERQIGDTSNDLQALEAALAALQAQFAEDQAVLARKKTLAQAQHTIVVAAPVAGRVLAIPAHVGDTLGIGAAIAILMPAGATLSAELYAPSRSSGFIQKGQEVRLMYHAFPYQTFGTARAVISSVSSALLAPGDAGFPGAALTEPVFRVRARLDDTSVTAYGRRIPVRPGMTLTADVLVEERSLLQWLLDPVYAARRRS